jgi:hypothetical protein
MILYFDNTFYTSSHGNATKESRQAASAPPDRTQPTAHPFNPPHKAWQESFSNPFFKIVKHAGDLPLEEATNLTSEANRFYQISKVRPLRLAFYHPDSSDCRRLVF